jgi:hypothetical protein
MRRATLFSLALHLLLLLLSVFGLPLFNPDWEPPAEAIPVELATVAEKTNIPVRPEPQKKPVEKPEPKPEAKPAPEKPKPAPPPPPPEPEAEPVPVPDAVKVPTPEKAEPKPETKPEPERVVKVDGPRPKVKPKRQPQQEEKKENFDLKKIAALLDKLPAEKAQQADTETKPETADELPPTEAVRPTTSAQMTLSEIDAIRAQVEQCWSVPAGARYAENLMVRVRIYLRRDGGLAQPPEVVDTLRMSMPGEEAFRTAAESAVRAIMKCEPFKNLPAEKYDRWRDIELNFDPRSMLNG